MERFYGQRVLLPLDSTLCMTDGNLGYMERKIADDYKLVMYYDSSECTSCRLKTLYEWQDVIDSASSYGHSIDFYFFFNVPGRRLEEIKATLTTYAHRLPIYRYNRRVRKNEPLPAPLVANAYLSVKQKRHRGIGWKSRA